MRSSPHSNFTGYDVLKINTILTIPGAGDNYAITKYDPIHDQYGLRLYGSDETFIVNGEFIRTKMTVVSTDA